MRNSVSRLRIVLGNSSLAHYPEGGGHWTCFLQFFLGLHALGHDVFWLEVLNSKGDALRDRQLIKVFFDRMRQYGVEERCILLLKGNDAEPITFETTKAFGQRAGESNEIVTTADLLWNFASALRQPLLSSFKRRVLVDVDPGIWQVSALDWDMGQNDHDVFLTVGSKLRDIDCKVPSLGLPWHPFSPVIYLPMWEIAPDPGSQAPFTSVTQWNWGELWLGKRVLSAAKRDAYLQYVELPARAGRPFKLAANIHPNDQTGDRELLERHQWTLVHPHEVAGSPATYQNYIKRSRAEICCPKPIYRDLKTGWLSDRSAGYLATGRPVLAEDTGFSEHFPTGNGLLAFQNMEEALAGVAEIDRNYAHHSHAARGFAEEFLDSRLCLPAMLAACG